MRGRAPGEEQAECREAALAERDVGDRLHAGEAAAASAPAGPAATRAPARRRRTRRARPCAERVLGGGVVEARDVPEVHDSEPDNDRRPGARERAERSLHAHQPARGGPHDHPRQRRAAGAAARCRRAARAGPCGPRRGSPRRARRSARRARRAARACRPRRRSPEAVPAPRPPASRRACAKRQT